MHGMTDELLVSLRARPDVESVTGNDGLLSLALRDGARVAPIVAWLVQHDVDIEEVRKARATLEDVFLDLMGPDGATSPEAGGQS
jgi:hypothetical protein